MAKNSSTVYLGFEDEQITEKNKFFVNFATNKVGGQPMWPSTDINIPTCSLCGLKRLLIVQIYAPLDNSQFHRTLYVFACPNSTCSNQSSGWICVRVQQIEKVVDKDMIGQQQQQQQQRSTKPNINWCSGANNWDDELPSDGYTQIEDNCSGEQNGNVINRNDNRMSDEDDESNSLENDLTIGIGNLKVDETNANCEAQGGGAVGRINSPNAFAEIEGDESEALVSVDIPQIPQRDLIAMLKQTTAVPIDVAKLTIKSFFISVDEEVQEQLVSDHIRELMQDYQNKDEHKMISPSSPDNCHASGGFGDTDEMYEKGIPVHGDIMFHNFLLNIQENPGQILRYSRDTLPILLAPLSPHELAQKCQNCGADVICELQILPTIIPKLKFINGDAVPLEFGNILVYTCSTSCWDTPDKMRTEVVVVQQGV